MQGVEGKESNPVHPIPATVSFPLTPPMMSLSAVNPSACPAAGGESLGSSSPSSCGEWWSTALGGLQGEKENPKQI